MNPLKTGVVMALATLFTGLIAGLLTTPALSQPVCRLTRPERDLNRRETMPAAELDY